MTKFRVTDDQSRLLMLDKLETLEPPFVVEVHEKTKLRSLDQNALVNVWYRQIGQEYGMPTEEARAYCKLIFGIPMLREKSQEFRDTYDRNIKKLSYRQKMLVIQYTDMPVTSTFNTKEMNEYMKRMQHHFGEQGLELKVMGEL